MVTRIQSSEHIFNNSRMKLILTIFHTNVKQVKVMNWWHFVILSVKHPCFKFGASFAAPPPPSGLILVFDNYITIGSNMSLLHKYFHKFSLMINVLALDSQTFCKRKSVFTPARSSVHTETVATVWWLVLREGSYSPNFRFRLTFYSHW